MSDVSVLLTKGLGRYKIWRRHTSLSLLVRHLKLKKGQNFAVVHVVVLP